MNVALWVVAGMLAAIVAGTGLAKLTQPKERLLEAEAMGWVEDFDDPVIRLIGAAEVLAAIGLVVPALVDVVPILVPIAASGLAVLAALATATHVRRRELDMVVTSLALLAMAVFVAWGRFGPEAF